MAKCALHHPHLSLQMENLRLLLSSVVLLAVISGQLSRQFEANWRFGKAKQYCGQYLNKELAIVCNGTYNSFYCKYIFIFAKSIYLADL